MDPWFGLIILPLFVGFGLGYADFLGRLTRRVEGPLTRISLLILLFLMGAKIGSDGEVLRHIVDIGVRSILIAGASIAGSVVVLKAITPWLGSVSDGGDGLDGASPKLDFKLTLSILVVLVLGGWLGYAVIPPGSSETIDLMVTYTLGLLLLAVGISLGLNKDIFEQVIRMGWRIILIPLAIAAGSIFGAMGTSFLINLSPLDTAAVGAGFGWYSLSAILLTELKGPELGATAFLANIFRELLTFIALPFLAKFLGKVISIAPGGATAMDVTLPLIKEIGGEEMVLPAFFSGAVLSSLVPLLVPLIAKL